MARVKCMNCQQMGHYKSRCPNPLVPEDGGDGGYGGGNADNGGYVGGGADAGGFDAAPSADNAGEDWGAAAGASGGGW